MYMYRCIDVYVCVYVYIYIYIYTPRRRRLPLSESSNVFPRLVVALSRARLGLYVFGDKDLFGNCIELRPAFDQLLRRPTKLRLLTAERAPTSRRLDAPVPAAAVTEIEGLVAMGKLVAKMQVIHMYIYMSRERGRDI